MTWRPLYKKLLAGAFVLATTAPVLAVDAQMAETLIKREGCGRCHTLDRPKEGPPFKEVAAKLKGKSDAEQQIIKHLTSGVRVKFKDGREDEHKIIKTTDSEAVRNLAKWILAQ